MSIRNSSNSLDNLLSQIARQNITQRDASARAAVTPNVINKKLSQDIVSLSQPKLNNEAGTQKSFTLSSETTDDIENGFRREQEFSKGNKKFIRIEEVTTTPDRSKKVVIQQNESGSTTVLENILDRQDDGTFRLTQQYTNEVGETQTNIELNFNPQDANILLGRTPSSSSSTTSTNNPFQQTRGTEVDLRV